MSQLAQLDAEPAAIAADSRLAALIARECPTDPGELIAVLRHALELALKWKVDGSAHHHACLARTVNAIPVACSEKCMSVQVALAWAQANPEVRPFDKLRVEQPPRQLRLEVAG